MKYITFTLLLFFGLTLTSQAQFNDYKYIVVPIKFNAFKRQNQHKTSTLVKHILVKQGFTVVYSDNLPIDLNENRCKALYADLDDNSSMFTTKTSVLFMDCNGVEIYRTAEAKSKEKAFEVAYKESIEGALRELDGITYSYKPKSSEESDGTVKDAVTISFKNDVKKLDEPKKIEEVVSMEKSTPTEQVYKSVKVEPSNLKKASVTKEGTGKAVEVLYAQPIESGYQLVDTTPKVIYYLTKTSSPDIFLVEGLDKGSGLIHKKEGKWVLEYNGTEGKIIKELNIKFLKIIFIFPTFF